MSRPVLAKISSNRQKGPNLSIADQARIYRRALIGVGVSAIAKAKQLPKTTISTTLKHINIRDTYELRPRSGCLKLYLNRDKRRIYRYLRKDVKA